MYIMTIRLVGGERSGCGQV